MTDFVSSSEDGQIKGENGSYATTRSTSVSFITTGDYTQVGQSFESSARGTYVIRRSFLKFDTSAIDNGATIASVRLRLTAQAIASVDAFDIQIVKQDWSAQDPIAAGTREAAYDGCLSGTADNNIWKNSSAISVNTPYESGLLDTSWINKTGNTYYSLRSSRDYGNTAPSSSLTETENVEIYTSEIGTSAYRPYLVITYTINYRKLLMTVHAH